MTTLESKDCYERFAQARFPVNPTVLCADQTTTLDFDLGSPMVLDGKLIAVAMPYMQVRSIDFSIPQRFTRLSLCADWIESVTAEQN